MDVPMASLLPRATAGCIELRQRSSGARSDGFAQRGDRACKSSELSGFISNNLRATAGREAGRPSASASTYPHPPAVARRTFESCRPRRHHPPPSHRDVCLVSVAAAVSRRPCSHAHGPANRQCQPALNNMCIETAETVTAPRAMSAPSSRAAGGLSQSTSRAVTRAAPSSSCARLTSTSSRLRHHRTVRVYVVTVCRRLASLVRKQCQRL